jgi:hypothetical protein
LGDRGRGLEFKASLGKVIERSYIKTKYKKMKGVEEWLSDGVPSTCQALNTSPNIRKKRRKKEKERRREI